ncbi:hypothetical protein L7F22_008156, partial [Adiantum nelumboides]|nr:hypothetical protein [Adiantum nelumboides]
MNAIQVLPTVALSTSSISEADEVSIMDEFLDSLCSSDESVIDDTESNEVSNNDVSLKRKDLGADFESQSQFGQSLSKQDLARTWDSTVRAK